MIPHAFRSPALAAATLLAVLALAGCTTAPAPGTDPDPAVDGTLQPLTSRVDDRAYAYRTLPNGLQVLLVSDPGADEAAAALAVFTGSHAEPAAWPGLAHFLEHMLFLGTEKYPEPDGYQQFIAQNGGGHNAYTAADHTNYFFSVQPDAFPEALDRFAQFFVAPLLTPEYVGKEVQAVHQEYQLQLKQDSWRGFMVQKEAMNPAHPASRFNIGARETLQDEGVLEALRAFYERWYSADRMALVVVAPGELDALDALVRERFAAVPDRDAPLFRTDEPLFRDLPRRLEYIPIRDAHTLAFHFPLPDLEPDYRQNPAGYLSNLLGHEGEGSLHHLLTERGWIDSLAAGAGNVGRDAAEMTVTMELTEAGLEHRAEIEELVFAYLALLRERGISAERYDEQARLAELAFLFGEKAPPSSWARTLAANLMIYPPRDVIRGDYAMDAFDEVQLEAYLDRLVPENVLITFSSPTVEADRTERWFGVEYALRPVAEETLLAWLEPEIPGELALPGPNPFVPEALDLVADGADDLPDLDENQPGLAFWRLTDTEFGVPRAQVRMRLDAADAVDTPDEAALLALYLRLVDHRLNAYAYPARLAGLSYGVSASSGGGLSISVGGYDDKLPTLLRAVLEALRTAPVDPERVELFREELARDWDNALKARPYEQTAFAARQAVLSPLFTPQELAEAVRRADAPMVEAYRDLVLAEVRVELLATGNLSDGDVEALRDILRDELPLANDVPRARPGVADLRPYGDGALRRWDVDHEDASITWYVQGRDDTLRERALFGLLGQMLRPAYFDDLRTERQLGYVVSAGAYPLEGVPGLRFIVQSSRAGAGELARLTGEFVDRIGREELPAMSDEAFDRYRQGLITLLTQRDQNLGERSGRLWQDLQQDVLTFDTRARIADEVAAIDKATFEAFYEEFSELARSQFVLAFTPGRFETGALPGRPEDNWSAFKQSRPAFGP